MGGTITVASVPGQGSTFRIWLPADLESAGGDGHGEPGLAGQIEEDRAAERPAEAGVVTPGE
jgi:hypothetical protein